MPEATSASSAEPRPRLPKSSFARSAVPSKRLSAVQADPRQGSVLTVHVGLVALQPQRGGGTPPENVSDAPERVASTPPLHPLYGNRVLSKRTSGSPLKANPRKEAIRQAESGLRGGTASRLGHVKIDPKRARNGDAFRAVVDLPKRRASRGAAVPETSFPVWSGLSPDTGCASTPCCTEGRASAPLHIAFVGQRRFWYNFRIVFSR